jgi:ferritin-like metal-binding protein YciE
LDDPTWKPAARQVRVETLKGLGLESSESPPRRDVPLFCCVQQEMLMANQDKRLDDLFYEALKDIYYAENKIVKALTQMAKAAQSKDLQTAFEKHKRETEGQVHRLERVFGAIDRPAKGKTCDAIEGMIDESLEVMTDFRGSPALDAGLLAAAQAVEHYEISRYGTLKAWAEHLGLQDAAKLLDQTLKEEKKTDEALTKLAESALNEQAEQAAE